MAHPRGIYSRQNAKGKTSWYVRVALHGRMKHYGGFPSQRVALDFYDRVKHLRREQRTTPGRTTVIEYTIPEMFAAYLPKAAHRRAFREQQRFAKWWTAYWPHQRVFDISPQHLEQARVDLRLSGRYGKRSERTVNHHLIGLRHAMRVMIQPRSWVVDLWSQITLERPRGEPPAPLLPQDEATLRQHLSPDDADKVRLGLLTGLRRAQLFGLRWEHLYWNERGVALPTIKQQRARFLPLPQEALEILHRRWQKAGQPQNGPAFPHPVHPDRPEDADAWYKYRFKKAVKAAGLAHKRIKFHSTRHGFAVRFLEAGGHVRALQRAGGWSSLDQVEIYTQMQDDQLRGAMDQAAKIGNNGTPTLAGRRPKAESNCRKLQKPTIRQTLKTS
jgi:integrase